MQLKMSTSKLHRIYTTSTSSIYIDFYIEFYSLNNFLNNVLLNNVRINNIKTYIYRRVTSFSFWFANTIVKPFKGMTKKKKWSPGPAKNLIKVN